MSSYQAVPVDGSTSTSKSRRSLPDAKKHLQPLTEEINPTGQAYRAKMKQKFRYCGRETWAVEIFSCILSIVTLAASFIVLGHYNGYLIPVVLPYGVKLGSLLSVFSTIIKAAIYLPLSTGLGQMVWLTFRQGYGPLSDMANYDNASRGILGGFILLWKRPSIIPVLGVLGFALAFAIGPSIQATLGSAYVAGVSTLPRCESVLGQNLGTLFNQYQASVFLSDFSPSGASDESLQSLNTNCLTGNCEWPVFSSLAICSNTTDIKSQARQTLHEDGSLASITLPNGLSLAHIGKAAMYWNGSVTLPTLNYQDWSYPPLARFSIVFYHYDFRGRGPDFRAAEGVFYWCVQAYNAKVTENVLSSKISSVWHPSDLNTSAQILNLSPPSESLASLGLNNSTNFTVLNQGTQLDFINSSLNINNTWYDPPNQLEVIAGLAVDSFPTFFAYLAEAMSNRMRSALCNLTVSGKMNQEQVLRVEWKWMILPSGTILLVCVFLAVIIWDSDRRDVKIWKNNILAVLFHGLSESILNEFNTGHVVNIADMEAKAKHIVVHLSEGGEEDDMGFLLRPK